MLSINSICVSEFKFLMGWLYFNNLYFQILNCFLSLPFDHAYLLNNVEIYVMVTGTHLDIFPNPSVAYSNHSFRYDH